MATSIIIEKKAISQFPLFSVVKETDVVTGLVNGKNAIFPLMAVANLVTKERIGLGKVEDLSPSEMPISDLQQQALDNKLDKDGVIEMSQVNGLPEALETILTSDIDVERITGLTDKVNTVIDGRQDLEHEVVKGVMDW